MFKRFVILFLGLLAPASVLASVPAPVPASVPASTPAPAPITIPTDEADETDETDETYETPNYCHDAEKNADWEVAIKRFPKDTILLRLYALRRGLCVMIDEGSISLDFAIDLFDGERVRWHQERSKR